MTSPSTRRRDDSRRRTASITTTVSVVAHLGLAAMMTVQFSHKPIFTAVTPPPMMVSMEAPSAPPTPAPTEDPPSERPQPQSARPNPPKLDIKPRTAPTPIAPPFTLPLPEPSREAPTAPRSTPSRESASSAPPQPSAPPATRAAGAVTVTWQGRVMARLESVKRYPRGARARRVEGVVYVRFSVDRAGRVTGVSLARSSGHPELDQEALAAVYRAQPLPRPPDEVPGNPIDLTVESEFLTAR